MCNTYNLIFGTVQMLVMHHFIPIHYSMEEIRRYYFISYVFLRLIQQSYFIPVCCDLDSLPASTNWTNFIFCKINLACVPGFYVDKRSMYL